jgi:hypothetical protein
MDRMGKAIPKVVIEKLVCVYCKPQLHSRDISNRARISHSCLQHER